VWFDKLTTSGICNPLTLSHTIPFALSLSKGFARATVGPQPPRGTEGFDKLSPNGK
jgi:hypothetical protein